MKEENPIGKIAAALCKAQAVMTGAKKGKTNIYFNSKYADLASVFEAIRDPFFENGLSVTQTIDVTQEGRMILSTVLMHTSGEYLKSSMILPNIVKPQEIGSAITYYRRYSLMCIAGLPSEDDDGNAANQAVQNRQAQIKNTKNQQQERISEEQWQSLDNFVNGYDDLRDTLHSLCKVTTLRNITVDQLEACRKRAQAYLKQKKESNQQE